MDFRDLRTIVSNPEEFLCEDTELPVNNVNKEYPNVHRYMETHFRLLREDLLVPYRDAVKEFRSKQTQWTTKPQPHDVQVYSNARLVGMRAGNAGTEYVIKFDNVEGQTMKVDWINSKLLMFNSLLCISPDGFSTFFWAVVSTRRVKELHDEGIIGVRSADGLEVKFEHGIEYIMFESTSAFFEAYQHVLKVLQKPEMEKLAFLEHLVSLKRVVGEPQYLTSREAKKVEKFENCVSENNEKSGTGWTVELELTAHGKNEGIDDGWGGENNILISEDLERVDIGWDEDPNEGTDARWDWGQEPTVEEGETSGSNIQEDPFSSPYVDIDDSQEDAIKHGLSKKLAIIQGPAGTGKTFVGLFITKQLLANAKICSPIVVVCYTNRALDQFLEGIYKYESSLVRLGTGSKSQILKQCSLERFQRSSKVWIPRYLRCQKGRLRFLQDEIAEKLNFSANCMHAKCVSRVALSKVAREEHMGSLYFCNYCRDDDIYQSWLVGNDKVHPTFTCPLSGVDSPLQNTTTKSTSEFHEIRDEDDPLSIALCIEYCEAGDVWNLDVQSRQRLNEHWLHEIRLHGQKEFWNLAPEYENICSQIAETRVKIQHHTLSKARILGMTTTVAARFFDVLNSIKPQVMIVEEAAEVLEGQLLACLNPHIEHLILIGDHKQLRPSVATSQLSFSHNLDISLFERLVRNGIEYKTLEVQRRMRPAIAYLILGFYPTLRDHRSVQTLESVKGVRQNVFFLDHMNVEQCAGNSGSKLNIGEADLVVEFAMYLMNKCGYTSKDITILSMYRSQASEISKRFSQHFSIKKRDSVKDNSGDVPRVRSVDEFQGEESNIIILSLVRNTTYSDQLSPLDQILPSESIGFLGTPNRICVALSRARLGLYMFGNSTLLSEKSVIWCDIIDLLCRNGWIGSRMKLCCPNHNEIEFRVRTSEDFSSVYCPLNCGVTLKCGHPCPRICHIGGHDNAYCHKKCGKMLELCGHLCMKKCHAEKSDSLKEFIFPGGQSSQGDSGKMDTVE